MCFHCDDQQEILELIEKLKNEYTIESPTGESYNDLESNLIENSKLFICFLSLKFLNDYKCTSYLKFAFKFKKKVFLLKNEKFNNIPFVIRNNKNFTRSKSISLKYTSEETDRNRVKKNVYDYFK